MWICLHTDENHWIVVTNEMAERQISQVFSFCLDVSINHLHL